MAKTLVPERTSTLKIGWALLIFIIACNVLGQIGLLLFDPGGDTIFLVWAAFSFVTASILLIPYRRGERSAWYVVRAASIPYALVVFSIKISGQYARLRPPGSRWGKYWPLVILGILMKR